MVKIQSLIQALGRCAVWFTLLLFVWFFLNQMPTSWVDKDEDQILDMSWRVMCLPFKFIYLFFYKQAPKQPLKSSFLEQRITWGALIACL